MRFAPEAAGAGAELPQAANARAIERVRRMAIYFFILIFSFCVYI